MVIIFLIIPRFNAFDLQNIEIYQGLVLGRKMGKRSTFLTETLPDFPTECLI